MTQVINYEESEFDKIRRIDSLGNEFWSARQLMEVLGYSQWRNFDSAVKDGKETFKNSNSKESPENVKDHFAEASTMIVVGKMGKRKVDDWKLSRKACYLTTMHCDPRKETVAKAQAYFAAATIAFENKQMTLSQNMPIDQISSALILIAQGLTGIKSDIVEIKDDIRETKEDVKELQEIVQKQQEEIFELRLEVATKIPTAKEVSYEMTQDPDSLRELVKNLTKKNDV